MTRAEACLFCLALIVAAGVTNAAPRVGGSYTIVAEIEDAAGQRTTGGPYRVDGSIGGLGGLSSIVSPSEVAKHGYIGQLYEVIGLKLGAPSTNLNEAASAQLAAAPMLNDATNLAPLNPSTVAWSIASGALASISTSGFATAAAVYQDSPAVIEGAAQGLSGQFTLTILNVNSDNFGSYSGDGLDDGWQVQYFGQNNPNAGPNADPDGDGQNNLFENTAGLIPTDSNSRFTLQIMAGGSPTSKHLIFNPVVSGRTYLPQSKNDLAPGTWNPLSGTTQSDNGATRTVTDPNATGGKKIYRVQISRP